MNEVWKVKDPLISKTVLELEAGSALPNFDRHEQKAVDLDSICGHVITNVLDRIHKPHIIFAFGDVND